jgi:hypothetical protein
MKSWAAVLMIVPLVLSGHARPGEAFDADRVFTKGGYVLSLEGGYGEQFDAWNTTITVWTPLTPEFASDYCRGVQQVPGH